MRESIKAVCIVAGFVSALGSAIAWSDAKVNDGERLVSTAVAIVCVLGFSVVYFRRDDAPDYLTPRFGSFFDRSGFCFAFACRTVDNICFFETWFHNRYERTCSATVTCRSTGGLINGWPMEPMTFDIECGPAAFGVARVPYPIPTEAQGKRWTFEFGATVKYPEGKGRMVRFRDGLTIRTDADFRDVAGNVLSILAAAVGAHVWTSSPSLKVELPSGVAEAVPEEYGSSVEVFWKLDDPPLIEFSSNH